MPKAWINSISLLLRQSLPPLMTERSNATKSETEWLEELKWRETAFLQMDNSLLLIFLLTSVAIKILFHYRVKLNYLYNCFCRNTHAPFPLRNNHSLSMQLSNQNCVRKIFSCFYFRSYEQYYRSFTQKCLFRIHDIISSKQGRKPISTAHNLIVQLFRNPNKQVWRMSCKTC